MHGAANGHKKKKARNFRCGLFFFGAAGRTAHHTQNDLQLLDFKGGPKMPSD